jgi:SAM-dependent methyltransferase
MSTLENNWYGIGQQASRMGEYTTRVEHGFIRETLGHCEGGLTMLDVGGGNGRHASLVKELGHHPIVLERDPAPIDGLLKKELGIPAVMADAMELPVRSASVDVVLTIEVTVCTTGVGNNNRKYFAEVARVLKEDGLFIFTAFNRHSYLGLTRKLKRNQPAYEELYYTDSAGDYRRALGRAGFEVIATRGFRWPPFTRSSSSRLVPAAVFLETALLLRSIPAVSPWLCFAARKRGV